VRLVLASDHGGVDLKAHLARRLAEQGHSIDDLGTHGSGSVDYPDFAHAVARAIADGSADRGILVCGTGQGMAMSANKVSGVRAGVVADVFSARMIVEHNNAQIICLGARILGPSLADELVDAFLKASFEGGRHQRRVEKIAPS